MSIPHIGMKADEVLKMAGRSAEDATEDPTWIGRDEHGWIVVWHYADCVVILHRRMGCYRVREVHEVAR
ncbi:MAG: hypothetical protein EHM35_00600 [Planctomycetaceae bacterium]|nr:MAG: hypothetical protein EHM35_00600 [Planctomycetaceae bacterium]